MFSEHSNGCVGFASTWKTEVMTKNENVQTEATGYADSQSQSILSRNVEIQTENPEVFVDSADIDYLKLASFLKRICPSVLAELDKNNRSCAFDSLHTSNHYGYEDSETCKLYALRPLRTADNPEVKVTAVSWNCTGGVLAVGTSVIQHDSWCTHRGTVSLYGVDRKNFDPSAPPHKTLETPACTTAVVFHPFVPSVLAAGTYGGQVLVWKEGGDIEMSSSLHIDAVTQVSWLAQQPTAQLSLVSAGRDGRLFLWHIPSTGSVLQLSVGFVISMDYGARRLHSPLGTLAAGKELGITCFSFFKLDPSSFIAGVDGGGLLRCSTLSSKPSAVAGSDVPLLNPVLSSVGHHEGIVTCVRTSPHKEDIFVTCGSDETLHIYSYSQSTLLHLFHTGHVITTLTWWPSHSHLVAAWGMSLQVFDTRNGNKLPSPKLDGSTEITSANFHPQSTHLVAIGDAEGVVAVWKIPLTTN